MDSAVCNRSTFYQLMIAGDEALNDLFATIYKDADQETKMAMKKSFQTSGAELQSLKSCMY